MLRYSVAIAVVALGWTSLSAQPAQARDRLFQPTQGDYGDFTGQPMWALAARCAAVSEVYIERVDAEIKANPDLPPHHQTGEPWDVWRRDNGKERRAQFTDFGLRRLARDRPGQSAETIFEAEVARQVDMRRPDIPTVESSQPYRDECTQYWRAIEWVLIRMKRGWADQAGLG